LNEMAGGLPQRLRGRSGAGGEIGDHGQGGTRALPYVRLRWDLPTQLQSKAVNFLHGGRGLKAPSMLTRGQDYP
jgi:hypothetical protein